MSTQLSKKELYTIIAKGVQCGMSMTYALSHYRTIMGLIRKLKQEMVQIKTTHGVHRWLRYFGNLRAQRSLQRQVEQIEDWNNADDYGDHNHVLHIIPSMSSRNSLIQNRISPVISR